MTPRAVAKPWGRVDLPATLSALGEQQGSDQPIGEIWFDHPGGGAGELLVKYLFTAERLSIQVHPDDEAARWAGHAHGKDELWAILAAEPGAVIGLGLRRTVSREQLRQAALDGSIEQLVDWRAVSAGEVIVSPAGTIHALGAGLALVEIQQNIDLTYRLYDYGRPRQLHLNEAVAAADPAPFVAGAGRRRLGPSREVLAEGKFTVERLTGPCQAQLHASAQMPVWLVPLGSGASAAGTALPLHSVWFAKGDVGLEVAGPAQLLLAYCSAAAREDLVGGAPGNS